MQNKSAIMVFAVLLTIACLYQLSFTWIVSGVEKEAKEKAEAKIDSVLVMDPNTGQDTLDNLLRKFESDELLTIANTEVYPLLGFTYKECKENEINFGLDLQGGMNVTLEVSVVDVIKALAGYSKDPTFNQAVSDALTMQKTEQGDYVTLFGKAFSSIDPNARLAAIFHNYENKDKFPRDATNEEILSILTSEAESAIDRTEQILRTRIDNLGVVQPKIQRIGTSGRLLVELPGVKDKAGVRKVLQATARLEFWETYENSEIQNKLIAVNDYLKTEMKLKQGKDDKNKNPADTAQAGEATTEAGSDTTTESAAEETSDLLSMLEGDEGDTATDEGDTTKLLDQVDKETDVNPLYTILTPNIRQQNSGQQYFGKGPVVGYTLVKDTSVINQYFSRKDIKALLPSNVKFLWAAKSMEDSRLGDVLELIAIKITNREGRPALEGDVIVDARPTQSQLGNPEVSMTMNSEGAKSWKHITKENIGKSVAIVLDNYVYSYPTVQNEIAGGVSSIMGSFTVDEVKHLANILKSGSLPAPANIVEEVVVGPSLGKEAVESGLQSFIVALLIVLLYMVFYYARAGAIADIALLANMFFVIGVLASLGATLTLPGIAGIVLTIGMSVDANVLIYERVREELTQGKGIRLAIVDGYKNAYSSIIDANITTLLTGVILYVFGTGPIKGFATTLIIGICTSLFSAIFITRLVFEWQLSRSKDISFSTSLTRNAFKGINIRFVEKRKVYYLISGIIIAAGIISFATRGLNYGVDFTGGRSYQVRFQKSADIDQIATALENVFVSEDGIKQRPEVKIYGSSNQVKITTKYMVDDNAENAELMVESKLNEGLTAAGYTYSLESSHKVGPTVAKDIKVAAIWAVLFSLIVIFLYILMRFKRWQFGLGALIAMFHDVIVVLAIFSIFYGILPFSLEIDQAFIAAILTVVGYSINDTVVVFDRIREYFGIYKRRDRKEVINDALNSTLSRTFNTSLSTFFVLLMIFIFGGEVIRGFVFALMVGVVVGTYSSICVATPIVVDLAKKEAPPTKK